MKKILVVSLLALTAVSTLATAGHRTWPGSEVAASRNGYTYTSGCYFNYNYNYIQLAAATYGPYVSSRDSVSVSMSGVGVQSGNNRFDIGIRWSWGPYSKTANSGFVNIYTFAPPFYSGNRPMDFQVSGFGVYRNQNGSASIRPSSSSRCRWSNLTQSQKDLLNANGKSL